MAQKSIHILNKNGYSMFWSSMWDDKINFSKSFKKQIFLNFFFVQLIEDYNSFNIFKKNKLFIDNYLFRHNDFYKDFEFFNFLNTINFQYRTPFFNSKIWILKYQSWFLIFFFVFDLKTNKNKSVSGDSNKFNHIFIFYFKNLFLLNFKYENFKKINSYF